MTKTTLVGGVCLHALTTLFGAMLLAGCAENDIQQSGTTVRPISFQPTVETADWNTTRSAAQRLEGGAGQLFIQSTVSTTPSTPLNTTRGTKYTATTFADTETFHVSGYRYAENATVASATEANFMWNAVVTNSNDRWRTATNYYIPYEGDKIDFFAWHTAQGTTGVTPVNAAGGLRLTYEMPTDIAAQPDLLTAVATGETFSDRADHSVALPFTHQLTCVNIEMDDNVAPGTITEVAFLNIYTKATLKVGSGWDFTSGTKQAETAWTGLGFSTTDDTKYLKTGNSRQILTGLMMIPQTFTADNQQIRIVMDVNGTSKELYANLSLDTEHPTEWKAGTTVTYRVSTSDINVLNITKIAYPDGNTWGNAWIKSNFSEGNTVGLYAIDAEGAVRVDNTRLTYTSGAWSTDEGSVQLFQPGLRWFVYHPYSPEGLAHSGTKDDEVVATADDLFAEGIAAWQPNATQDSELELLAQDLQVGDGTLTAASTMQFVMHHTMGLVHLTIPAAKDVPNLVYFNGNNGTNSTEVVSTSSETTHYEPSRTFLTNKPFSKGDNMFLFIGRPGSVTLSASSASATTAWDPDANTASITATLSANSYTTHSVQKYITRGYMSRGWVYEYSGSVKTLTAPATGTYTLEVYGGQGGGGTNSSTSNGGNGGYAIGKYNMEANYVLYVCVGAAGKVSNGTTAYNGGAKSCANNGHVGGGGGGATHIATTTNRGELRYYTSNRSEVLLVAGGGGGSDDQGGDDGSGGTGGGTNGGNAKNNGALLSGTSGAGRGGTQTTGYAFGYGQTSTQAGAPHDAGGGGGGWYGGYGGNGDSMGGGGGSGYTNSSRLVPGSYSMSNGQRIGNGYARITETFIE